MTKNAYLPMTNISDKGSVCMSQVTKEVAEVLGLTLQHAPTKHAQTIGMLERTHASLKKALKVGKLKRKPMWLKYVNIAVLNYNTFYHTSIGCEPRRVFLGRLPYTVPDFKKGIRVQKTSIPSSKTAEDVLRLLEILFQDVRKNTMQAYINYNAYCHKIYIAWKLKTQQHVYVLQPNADHQGSKFAFTDFR